MPLTQIEITAEDSFADAIDGIATSFNTIDHYKGPAAEDGRRRHVLIAGRGDRQGLIDALQGLLSQSETARIVLFNVEATIPPEPEEKESDEVVAERRKQAIGATREELYNDVTHGADLDSAYLLQVVLSTIVAAIGMLEDNVAVVIGAMVIAPLLGPNLALSFGAALGDARLMTRAVTTGGVGLAVAISIGVAIGMLDLFPLTANELLSRTEVGLAGVVLALASGRSRGALHVDRAELGTGGRDGGRRTAAAHRHHGHHARRRPAQSGAGRTAAACRQCGERQLLGAGRFSGARRPCPHLAGASGRPSVGADYRRLMADPAGGADRHYRPARSADLTGVSTGRPASRLSL